MVMIRIRLARLALRSARRVAEFIAPEIVSPPGVRHE
ncbi:hypothetical protein FHW02_003770 [Ochrobactrum sp. RH1CCR137]|nr:hypothetical protein [Ochrobactrum sp. RH1CCR137]MBA8857410.1 hypothetical protein [Ochrobactrum sp. RH1CCR134]